LPLSWLNSLTIMQLIAIVALAALTLAMPQARTGSTSNELKSGSCKPVILIFARASTEPGNMGGSMGPIVCNGLKKDFPDKVICQGVGQPYAAGLPENVMPAGTTPQAIGEATKMFTTANSKCASSIIVFGGYSQGTAVMMNAVKGLPANIKEKVVGGVLFGYTKNAQTKGSIPGYPPEALKVFCNPAAGSTSRYNDGVCGGALNVNGGHFAYMGNGDGPKSIEFLKSRITPALAKMEGGGGGAPQSIPKAGPKGVPKGAPKGVPKGEAPSEAPAEAPSEAPVEAPSEAPSEAPKDAPSEAPSEA